MSKILVTGATGNVGFEVIQFLLENNSAHDIIAGVREIDKARLLFSNNPGLQYVHFDFENIETFNSALNDIDIIFLLRPPHLSDVDKFFKPLINKMKEKKINRIVFLSVQGADTSRIIPHNKIERLIVENGIDYIFLRPGYFMQNLSTTLLNDLRKKRRIILPASKARFNWIDIKNIGEIAAILIYQFEDYKCKAFDITGLENLNFYEVADLLNTVSTNHIRYSNMSLLRFYFIKRREGMAPGMIMVMMLLHFLPRFQKAPVISDFYEKLTGKRPTNLKAFIGREKKYFTEG